MGRRAKNKQAAPEPLEPEPWKLGKRKAEQDKTSSRPAKKAKDLEGKSRPKSVKKAAEDKPKKSKPSKPSKSKDSDEESAEGWEDVDDVDVKAEAK